MKQPEMKDLQRRFLNINGVKTAIYLAGKKNKPLIVMMHGFGGNYFGLSFLARELLRDWHIIIVELPSHGESELTDMCQLTELREWYRELTKKLEWEFGKISLVFAHSFGCYVVADPEITRKIPTILSNPVFKPTSFYLLMSKLSLKSRFMSVMQNLPPMPLIKAMFLWKNRSRRALYNLYQNALRIGFDYRQWISQSRMLGVVFEKKVFKEASGNYQMIIFGEFDDFNQRATRDELDDNFGEVNMITLSGGHLVPIELPEAVARVIKQEMRDVLDEVM